MDAVEPSSLSIPGPWRVGVATQEVARLASAGEPFSRVRCLTTTKVFGARPRTPCVGRERWAEERLLPLANPFRDWLALWCHGRFFGRCSRVWCDPRVAGEPHVSRQSLAREGKIAGSRRGSVGRRAEPGRARVWAHRRVAQHSGGRDREPTCRSRREVCAGGRLLRERSAFGECEEYARPGRIHRRLRSRFDREVVRLGPWQVVGGEPSTRSERSRLASQTKSQVGLRCRAHETP